MKYGNTLISSRRSGTNEKEQQHPVPVSGHEAADSEPQMVVERQAHVND